MCLDDVSVDEVFRAVERAPGDVGARDDESARAVAHARRRRVARRRVALGFLFGAVVLWLAQPTWDAPHARRGVRDRRRSAPHLGRRASREEPRGDAVGPVSLDAASALSRLDVHRHRHRDRRRAAALVVAPDRALSRHHDPGRGDSSEEAHLREKFGGEYDAYKTRQAAPMVRRFSLARARVNREHHTVAGLLIGVGASCAEGPAFDTIDGLPVVRAVSSVGRAPALHAGCHRFESCTAHQPSRW